ncbi:MAG TPA: DUF5916 domain-containing protein, partial [Thermoanaerobaculia bacterium]|nr:DUF5916 domain-containing protein [Thermoanaerobaculia bacterium]
DGQLEEAAWKEATPIPIAWEWAPADNAPALVETTVLVTFDDRNFYAAFHARDPRPKNIRARYQERDVDGGDDSVGLWIDTFNDDRRAYKFRINPLGVQRDSIFSDVENAEDLSWDAIWDSEARITEDGYIVEIAIPLQQLRIPARSGPQTWGLLAMRNYPRDVLHQLRSTKPDPNRNCFICLFPDFHGFVVPSGGKNIEATPAITGTDDKIDLGASARWAITPGTSLQATINPDFSQVEADAAQLDVNTRFALFFPEKRPFFVEGADFFATRMDLVFTRTIGDPSAGLKLTGKSGPSTYAVLVARDEITNVLIPGDQSSSLITIPGGSTTAIARYRHEFGKRTTIGGLVTARRGDGYENTVAAMDGFQRLSEKDSLRWQAAHSNDGHAISAGYSHRDQNWTWSATYDELSPEFRADSGFINQVGVRASSASAERRFRGGPKKWFRNLYIFGGVDGTRQYDGAWNEWGGDLVATYQGPMQSEISVALAPNQEFFAGTTYHDFRQSISAAFQPARDVALAMEVRWGETIDFTNRRQADFVTLSPSAQLSLGRRVRAEVSYDYQFFDTKDGRRIFEVHLPQARLLYHFSGRSFLRAILQYEMVRREPAQYTVPVGRRAQELLTQLLFSYRVNAQTVFLAGYSDDYQGANDLTRTDRAVFAKLSYAFLF